MSFQANASARIAELKLTQLRRVVLPKQDENMMRMFLGEESPQFAEPSVALVEGQVLVYLEQPCVSAFVAHAETVDWQNPHVRPPS